MAVMASGTARVLTTSSPAAVAPSRGLVKSAGAVGQHSYSPEEAAAFAQHLNRYLGGEPLASLYLPVDNANLFEKLSDGILLCCAINAAAAGTIYARAINLPPLGTKQVSRYAQSENANLAIASARAIGCQIVNVHASDVLAGTPHICLGLLWQIVKQQLLGRVNLKAHPELLALLGPSEALSDLLALPPEALLLRWFNHHLGRDGAPMRVGNLGPDVADGAAYLHLLHSIAPDVCAPAEGMAAAPPLERAKQALGNARALRVPVAIAPSDITSGNRRLNLAFVAELFNHAPGLAPPPLSDVAEAMPAAGLGEGDDAREERVYRLWMASVLASAGSGITLSDLAVDCRDGLALLDTVRRECGPDETGRRLP